jgi:hypothetical protein
MKQLRWTKTTFLPSLGVAYTMCYGTDDLFTAITIEWTGSSTSVGPILLYKTAGSACEASSDEAPTAVDSWVFKAPPITQLAEMLPSRVNALLWRCLRHTLTKFRKENRE